MAPKKISADHFSRDIRDFLFLLHKYKIKYVIVGGEAVIFYGHTRLTGDIDFFYDNSDDNVKKLYRMLIEFWEGDIPNIGDYRDLMKDDLVVQFGVPPNRIDLINDLGTIAFNEVWDSKEEIKIIIKKKKIEIFYISLKLLIQNKQNIGRNRDLDDLKYLLSIK